MSQTRQFTINNNCTEKPFWVGPGAGNPVPVFNGSSGGFETSSRRNCQHLSTCTLGSAGRFWGRRQCVFDITGHGSCCDRGLRRIAPVSTCRGWEYKFGRIYSHGLVHGQRQTTDISLVDAFDFPIFGRTQRPESRRTASMAACQVDLRASCPARTTDPGQIGKCGRMQQPLRQNMELRTTTAARVPMLLRKPCNKRALGYELPRIDSQAVPVLRSTATRFDDASSDFSNKPAASARATQLRFLPGKDRNRMLILKPSRRST